MNANAKKWVAALRSGEYKQDIGYLRREGKYCVLGVACDLAVKDNIITQIKCCDGSYSYDSHSYLPSNKVQEWIGLRSNNGEFNKCNSYTLEGNLIDFTSKCSLSAMNDSFVDFNDLADLIESEPHGLFKEED